MKANPQFKYNWVIINKSNSHTVAEFKHMVDAMKKLQHWNDINPGTFSMHRKVVGMWND